MNGSEWRQRMWRSSYGACLVDEPPEDGGKSLPARSRLPIQGTASTTRPPQDFRGHRCRRQDHAPDQPARRSGSDSHRHSHDVSMTGAPTSDSPVKAQAGGALDRGRGLSKINDFAETVGMEESSVLSPSVRARRAGIRHQLRARTRFMSSGRQAIREAVSSRASTPFPNGRPSRPGMARCVDE